MNKERLKSITLVCLIILNFVLGSLIVTDKKLWPSGYNFFISLENSTPVQFFTSLKNRFAGAPAAVTHLAAPETIIVNTGYQTSRLAVSPDEPLFSELTEACNRVLSSAFSNAEDPVRVSQDEWYAALMSKSIYLQYPADCESALFAQFLGVKKTEIINNVQSFSKLVVSTDDRAAVYAQDTQSGAYYRLPTRNAPDALLELIAEVQTGRRASSTSSSILNYSFDLKFDQPTSGQKAVIDPMIPIYSNPRTADVLLAENPLRTPTGALDEALVEQILMVFDMNPSTVRHYPETNGTIVFVENNAVLKLHTDGLLDYRAKGQGIRLSGGANGYSVHSEIADMADAVTNVVFPGGNLYVSSPLYESSTLITFDYLASGLPVILSGSDLQHAVEAQTENGYLLSYRQLLRRYTPTGQTAQTPAYISALDSAIDTYAPLMNEIVIDKLYLSYTDDGTDNAKRADWTVTVKSVVIGGE